MFDSNSRYLLLLLIGISAAIFAEGIYLLVYNNASYRKNINRRLKVMDGKPIAKAFWCNCGASAA